MIVISEIRDYTVQKYKEYAVRTDEYLRLVEIKNYSAELSTSKSFHEFMIDKGLKYRQIITYK